MLKPLTIVTGIQADVLTFRTGISLCFEAGPDKLVHFCCNCAETVAVSRGYDKCFGKGTCDGLCGLQMFISFGRNIKVVQS